MNAVTIQKADRDDAQGVQNVFYQTLLATYPNTKLGITKDDIHEIFKNAFSTKELKK